MGAALLSAVVLLLNLWLARRLVPPPSEGGTSSLRGLFDRINEAAQAAEGRASRPGSPFGDRRGGPGGPADASSSTPTTCPT